MKLIHLLCFSVLSSVGLADEITEIKILLPGDQSESEEGIRIGSLPTLSVLDENPQEFRISVINYFDDEIFLEIPDLEDIHVGSREYTVASFPDNRSLLKRLHGRKKMIDGSFSSCGCSMLSISGSAIMPEKIISDTNEGSLKKAKEFITLHLYLKGYFRKTGKMFRGRVNLPVIIKEFEPADADKPVNPFEYPIKQPND